MERAGLKVKLAMLLRVPPLKAIDPEVLPKLASAATIKVPALMKVPPV